MESDSETINTYSSFSSDESIHESNEEYLNDGDITIESIESEEETEESECETSDEENRFYCVYVDENKIMN